MAATALAPLMATAGNLETPAPTPAIPTVAPTTSVMDWSGAYVGLGYGTTSGDLEFSNIPSSFVFEDGSLPALFGGYQIQRGNLVYGGELSFGQIQDSPISGFAGIAEMTDNIIDLKGRIGYATGSFMVYGVLGYSTGTYTDILTVTPPPQADVSGLNYGIGVDYAVTDNWIVGAEYLTRDLDGDGPFANQTTNVQLETISLRVSYKF